MAKKTKSSTIAKTSKIAGVIALLQRKEGATLDEIVNATGWQRHSARAVLRGQISVIGKTSD